MHSGGLQDLPSGNEVKTKGNKNYLIKGLGNMGHSECPFLQWFCTLCIVSICITPLPPLAVNVSIFQPPSPPLGH